MSELNKTYRIRTNLKQDTHLNLNLNQDFDTLEVLSLKVNKEPFYKLHTANYGCLVGRVIANGNFGIPNAKVSVFIEQSAEDSEDSILSYLYPYKDAFTKDENGIRYNLLTEDKINDCHQNVGTFPSKRRVLDDNNVLEVFDTYYKFTTTTNESGDYMIFGVPTGVQTIHVDLDLSDIGILSQKPRDMFYKGYNESQFDSAEQFKKSTNLDNLAQIISQNSSVQIYPFWGEENEGDEVKITRRDIDIDYKFEPTCIFMGSVITDERSNGVSEKCIATDNTGLMESLTTGKGTIEMIRKKVDGTVESFSILGNQLIDGDGVWCYQIPMNLDYMSTDEFGNMIPSEDTEHGIPTRARVRFRLSMGDDGSDYDYSHYAKVLVPNNPKDASEVDYVFGSKTKDNENGTESFRDLFWNNIYSVKSFIPRIQKGNYQRNKKFTGIKRVNVYGSNNPIPYNNMRVDITFMFVLQCAILKMLIRLTAFVNHMIEFMLTLTCCNEEGKAAMRCVTIGEGACPDLENWYFAPGCNDGRILRQTLDNFVGENNGYVDSKSVGYQEKDDVEHACITTNMDYFMQCIEVNLAMENNVIQFDFYNDWMNGMIYIPRWFANIKKKRSYFFGLIKTKERIGGCTEEYFKDKRYIIEQCAIDYKKENGYITKTEIKTGLNYRKYHKSEGRARFLVFGRNGGLVHKEENMNKKYLYYFKPCERNNFNIKNNNQESSLITLYATDIILLGSLNDKNDLPIIINQLPSSTYKLPPNIVHTNQDSNGILYGLIKGNAGNLCSHTDVQASGVTLGKEEIDTKFSVYQKWQRSKDYKLSDDDFKMALSPTEYPVTEISGIDWGLDGPLQGSISPNHRPGGHFLGISCVASDVTIKSCINLHRICEYGVKPSGRHAVVEPIDDNTYTYTYFTPNGYISRDEIVDGDFRSLFATLNSNSLETEISDGVRHYKLQSIIPLNFYGGDKDEIYNPNTRTAYFEQQIIRLSDKEGIKEYRRTLEGDDYEYYKYRLGDKGEENFLIHHNDLYAMPVYKNSFYFYFGLHNGSTALDKLREKFYSECPDEDEINGVYNVTIDGGIEFCEPNNSKVSVELDNFILPATVTVKSDKNKIYVLKQNSDNNYIITFITQNMGELPQVYHSIFNITNIYAYFTLEEINVLTLSIEDARGNSVERSFNIEQIKPNFINDIKIDTYNFKQELSIEEYDSSTKTLKGNLKKISERNGCSILNNLKIWESGDTETRCGIRSVILVGERYYYCIGSGLTDDEKHALNITSKQEILKFRDDKGADIVLRKDAEKNVYDLCLWEGNQAMTLIFLYKNSYSNSGITSGITEVNITATMPQDLDFYFYDTHLTGKELDKYLGIGEYEWYYDSSEAWEKIYEYANRVLGDNSAHARFKDGIGPEYYANQKPTIQPTENAVIPPYTVTVIGYDQNNEDKFDGPFDVYVYWRTKKYEKTNKVGGIADNKWWENLNFSKLSDDEKWCLQKSVFYQNSVFEKNRYQIPIGVVGGVLPTTEVLTGSNETVVNDEGLIKINNSYVSKQYEWRFDDNGFYDARNEWYNLSTDSLDYYCSPYEIDERYLRRPSDTPKEGASIEHPFIIEWVIDHLNGSGQERHYTTQTVYWTAREVAITDTFNNEIINKEYYIPLSYYGSYEISGNTTYNQTNFHSMLKDKVIDITTFTLLSNSKTPKNKTYYINDSSYGNNYI